MPEIVAKTHAIDPRSLIDDAAEERRKVVAPGFPARTSTERRRSQRTRVLLGALIVDLTADTVVTCRAENVSDNGARIRLPEPRALPATFWLIAITAGVAYQARTVWRQDDRLGVEVGEPVHLDEATTGVERRLRAIWATRR